MELSKLKHIHFTGIKGVGMTALALCINDLGIRTTGSDVDEEFVTDEVLEKHNIKWNKGFGEKNLFPKPDLVIYTAAHGGVLNPEVQKAIELGIPTISYAEFLAEIANKKDVIGICGVGGKTTTTSMITVLLYEAGLNPSFAVGVGDIFPINKSGSYDKKSKYFICEADEYAVSPGVDNRAKFLLLDPKILVVTNIEYDHPDIYRSEVETLKTFRKLFEKLPHDGLLVASIDNPKVSKVIKDLDKNILTYGINKDADYQIKDIRYTAGESVFSIYSKNENKGFEDIKIKLPGEFNILNATAAFIVGLHLNIHVSDLKKGLAAYRGCRRRFEKMGKFGGAIFYDDYAHHPSEIKATLKAVRDWYPGKRVVAIFQPHTYTRTKALLKDFSSAFGEADMVGIMDIYLSARESKDETISAKILADMIRGKQKDTYYLGNQKETVNWINDNVKEGDIVLTMGAGDIFHLYKQLALKGLAL